MAHGYARLYPDANKRRIFLQFRVTEVEVHHDAHGPTTYNMGHFDRALETCENWELCELYVPDLKSDGPLLYCTPTLNWLSCR